jgi:hypothetical protein
VLFGVLIRYRPHALAPVAVVLFTLVATYSEADGVLAKQRELYHPGWISPGEVAKQNRVRHVGYDMDHLDRTGIWIYQWFLPHTEVGRFWGSRERPPGRYVISSKDWEREHPADTATLLWADSDRDQALWRVVERGESGPTTEAGR